MNTVALVGRLTKDPDVRTAGETKVASMTLAVDRPYQKGEEKQADFIGIKSFGKQADFVGNNLTKGRQIAVTGRIQTGSYENSEGRRVYTFDVVAERIEFVGPKPETKPETEKPKESVANIFETLEDDDIPF